MNPPAFRVSTQNVIYEYHPILGKDNYYVKSWVDNKEQPLKIITDTEAKMAYDFCSSMWIDFEVEVI